KALPVPQAGIAGADFVAPRTTAEQTLAAIWSEVLKLERVGVHDDFFELGGHSLLATRVLARLRDALSVELPLRALFEAPRLAGLAARVEREQREGRSVILPPLAVQMRPERLALSYAQERLWFLNQLGLVGSAYNMPFAVRLEGELDVAALERSLGEVVRRHEALRTRFEVRDGQGVQIIDPP